jgi:gliding motility-associated-like protein
LNGCKVRDSIRVAFFAFPADWLGPDRALCEGQTLRLSASTPGATYRWQDGSTSPVFTVDRAGSYTVEVKVGVCVQRDTVRMTYNPLPVFSLGKDTTLCGNTTFSLLAPEEADAYRWSTGASSRQLSVSQSGLVWAEATLSGCSWRDSITIRFQPVPRPSLGPDTTICTTDQLLLKSNIQAERYEWQDGSTGPQLAVKEAGTYILTTSDGLCRGSDTIVVQTRKCTVFSLFAPNAFSPNGDGVNDAFIPQLPPDVEVIRYELRLFDRWGNLVFQSQTPGQGWDGTYRGAKLPQGVFLYALSIQVRDDVQEIQDTFSGDVLLLR